MFRLIVALCIFGGALSASVKPQDGSTTQPEVNVNACIDLKDVKDFNLTRFPGFWYLAQKSSDHSDNEKNDCPIMDFVVDENSDLVKIDYASGVSVMMSQVAPNSSKFHSTDGSDENLEMILATDYQTYAVISSCLTTEDESRSIKVLTRSYENFTVEFGEKLNDVLRNLNITPSSLLSVDRHLCHGLQLVARGKNAFRKSEVLQARKQCEKFNDYGSFNLTRFLGTWYEIQTSSVDYEMRNVPSDFDLYRYDTKLGISSWSIHGGYYDLLKTEPNVFMKNVNDVITHNCTVVNTDYVSFAVLYVCPQSHKELPQIITLAREKEDTESFRLAVDDALTNSGLIGITHLLANPQLNCTPKKIY